jgi:hypothetical protein
MPSMMPDSEDEQADYEEIQNRFVAAPIMFD